MKPKNLLVKQVMRGGTIEEIEPIQKQLVASLSHGDDALMWELFEIVADAERFDRTQRTHAMWLLARSAEAVETAVDRDSAEREKTHAVATCAVRIMMAQNNPGGAIIGAGLLPRRFRDAFVPEVTRMSKKPFNQYVRFEAQSFLSRQKEAG